jgi:hypothetical protein
MINKAVYKLFGLRVLSDIPLPEAPQYQDNENKNDVVIELLDSSELWREFDDPQKTTVVKKDLFLLNLPRTAKFCVQEGKKITVLPEEGANKDQVRLYLLGTCMGVLLMQRKVLPLHGSAIAIDGKAYAFVGESGSGKSSLAAAFLEKGYKLLSDDVIPVSFSEDKNIPFVIPSYPQQKLWKESLDEFGMKNNDYQPIFLRENKYVIPVSEKFYNEPLPLCGVFEIIKTDNQSIEIHQVEGIKRLHLLLLHTYRNYIIRGSELTEWHFNTSVKMINQINVFQLRRPTSGFTAYQMVSLILTTLGKEI